MDKLLIEPTETSPGVDFDPIDGTMLLHGRSIPEDAERFWASVLSWFYAYSAEPVDKTVFTFKMDYFNIPSSKRILYLLNKMQSLHELGVHVEVIWYYAEDDNFMKEVGSDFSTVVTLPFELRKLKAELV